MNRTVSHCVAMLLSLHAALVPSIGLAQAVPDPVLAPVPVKDASPIVGSANGTPVVNIAAPNAQGVSHNKFTSYDVDPSGLIINNSAVPAVSLIGGGTAANRNLAGGAAASLIINEVIAANTGSRLLGYQEVLGPKAELVIANPWGITCNGCGFVNTPRVTLTTGTPQFGNGGGLSGFTISGGQIAIGADGLDASRASVLDLVARSVKLDGSVFAGSSANKLSGTIGLFGGAGSFNYNARSGTGAPGTGPAPEFAIDSGLLGGLYADRIALIVNEAGAGVRNAGNMAAFADDLTIDAKGKILLTGATSATRDVAIAGTDVTIAQADPKTGIVFAGRGLSVAATGALKLGAGDIGAQGDARFAAGSLTDTGAGNRFALGTSRLSADAATMSLGATWSANNIALTGASITTGKDALVFATGYIRKGPDR